MRRQSDRITRQRKKAATRASHRLTRCLCHERSMIMRILPSVHGIQSPAIEARLRPNAGMTSSRNMRSTSAGSNGDARSAPAIRRRSLSDNPVSKKLAQARPDGKALHCYRLRHRTTPPKHIRYPFRLSLNFSRWPSPAHHRDRTPRSAPAGDTTVWSPGLNEIRLSLSPDDAAGFDSAANNDGCGTNIETIGSAPTHRIHGNAISVPLNPNGLIACRRDRCT